MPSASIRIDPHRSAIGHRHGHQHARDGALLTFVASAPQLMRHALELGASAFALLQVLGVASFIVMASQSGRISQRLGPAGAIRVGAFAAVCDRSTD